LSIFNKLSDSARGEIEQNFKLNTNQELLTLLDQCKYYFESARYPFEKIGGSYGISSIRTLAYGLLEAVQAYGIEQQGRYDEQ